MPQMNIYLLLELLIYLICNILRKAVYILFYYYYYYFSFSKLFRSLLYLNDIPDRQLLVSIQKPLESSIPVPIDGQCGNQKAKFPLSFGEETLRFHYGCKNGVRVFMESRILESQNGPSWKDPASSFISSFGSFQIQNISQHLPNLIFQCQNPREENKRDQGLFQCSRSLPWPRVQGLYIAMSNSFYFSPYNKNTPACQQIVKRHWLRH